MWEVKNKKLRFLSTVIKPYQFNAARRVKLWWLNANLSLRNLTS